MPEKEAERKELEKNTVGIKKEKEEEKKKKTIRQTQIDEFDLVAVTRGVGTKKREKGGHGKRGVG